VRGRGERRLPELVAAEDVRAHSATRRPAVEPGELALLYAAGWRVEFGVVEVVGELEHDPSRARWGWRFPIRPLLLLDDLRRAPPVEAAGVSRTYEWRPRLRGSTPAQFEAGCAAIEAERG